MTPDPNRPDSTRPDPSRRARRGVERSEQLAPRAAASERVERAAPEFARPRPRSIGEQLDLAIEVLRRRFLVLAGPSFLAWLPGRWCAVRLDELAAQHPTNVAVALLPLALALVESMLVTIMVAGITYSTLRGEVLTLGQAAQRLVRRLPVVAAVTFVRLALIVLGLATCGVMSIFFWWRLLFIEVTAVVDEGGPNAAIWRSFALTRTGFLRWMGLFALATLFNAPLSVVAGAFDTGDAQEFLRGLLPELGATGLEVVSLVTSSFFLAVPAAFFGVIVTVHYLDARVRQEGWDLELELERLEARTGAGA